MRSGNKIKWVVLLCSLSLSAFANNFYPVNLANGDQNTVDVAMMNNSGHTLTYLNTKVGPYSQCPIVLGGTTIVPGAYFIVRGTYSYQGGQGLSCQLFFAVDNNSQHTVNLNIVDPTQEYSGTPVFNMFDGGTQVSGNYSPVPYPVSPEQLKDASATMVINSF